MSILMVNERVEFTRLKDLLDVTDGNLASHIKSLEKEGYIMTIKQFIRNKPNTSYGISKEGRLAFIEHIEALEKLLKK